MNSWMLNSSTQLIAGCCTAHLLQEGWTSTGRNISICHLTSLETSVTKSYKIHFSVANLVEFRMNFESLAMPKTFALLCQLLIETGSRSRLALRCCSCRKHFEALWPHTTTATVLKFSCLWSQNATQNATNSHKMLMLAGG